MALKVNLRHLEEHGRQLKGELPVEELELDIQDEMIRTEKPLVYDLEIEKLHDALLVQGRLDLTLDCECVRCLKPFKYRIKIDPWAAHLPLEGEEKVSLKNDFVDLTPFLREDILLEFPRHPLCKPDCGGLKKSAK
ncbi:MAG TPA: YceD family protein, partial [Desulfuromonadaceae bacterium]|nr:YceD family protein [Desulfuromonadaceae bacterium]